jgi:hypothetical protein
VDAGEDLIEVLWEDESGRDFVADYLPDGTSKWIYKGMDAEFPTDQPPAMPATFNGQEVKFESPPSENVESKTEKGATEEAEKKSAGKGPHRKVSAGKAKEKKTAGKRGKKDGKAAASSESGPSKLLGIGLSVGMGIATSKAGHEHGRGMKKHEGGSHHPLDF